MAAKVDAGQGMTQQEFSRTVTGNAMTQNAQKLLQKGLSSAKELKEIFNEDGGSKKK
jgi:hypothetical protein